MSQLPRAKSAKSGSEQGRSTALHSTVYRNSWPVVNTIANFNPPSISYMDPKDRMQMDTNLESDKYNIVMSLERFFLIRGIIANGRKIQYFHVSELF